MYVRTSVCRIIYLSVCRYSKFETHLLESLNVCLSDHLQGVCQSGVFNTHSFFWIVLAKRTNCPPWHFSRLFLLANSTYPKNVYKFKEHLRSALSHVRVELVYACAELTLSLSQQIEASRQIDVAVGHWNSADTWAGWKCVRKKETLLLYS